jgi:hypothetical protein
MQSLFNRFIKKRIFKPNDPGFKDLVLSKQGLDKLTIYKYGMVFPFGENIEEMNSTKKFLATPNCLCHCIYFAFDPNDSENSACASSKKATIIPIGPKTDKDFQDRMNGLTKDDINTIIPARGVPPQNHGISSDEGYGAYILNISSLIDFFIMDNPLNIAKDAVTFQLLTDISTPFEVAEWN